MNKDMNKDKRNVAVGVFPDHVQADAAIAELRRSGFRDDQIGIVGPHEGPAGIKHTEGSKMGEGVAIGALAGVGAGGLVGLGILAGVIPVIGPVIAGGTLAMMLANAAGGAAIGGLVGGLVGLGIPEEEANYYESEVKTGRTVVTVKAENRYAEAERILRSHKSYDYHCKDTAAACATTSNTARATSGTGRDQKIELREEELTARKQNQKVGEVEVRKEIVTEHRTIDVPVRREEVVIERHAASGQRATSNLKAGEEVRIPVMEEQVSVEKRAVVKEEVTVGKRTVQGTEHVSGDVRKEELRVTEKGDVNLRGANDANKKRK